VVLSLAYSLYTATSILLLELQASPSNPQRYTMERLSYCFSALERVKKTNPGTFRSFKLYMREKKANWLTSHNPLVIATASKLIRKELMVLGLDIHALTTSRTDQTTDPSATTTTTRPFHPPRFVPLSSTTHQSSSSHNNVPLNMHQQQPATTMHEEQNMVFMDASYLDNGGDVPGGLDYDLLDMSPSTFEAFTQVEPLSTTMNPGFDFF
jgi:hypothetical protein